MKPAVKYWIFLIGIVATIFAVILCSFVGSWYSLAPEEQAFVGDLTNKLIPFPLLGALVLVAIIGSLVSLLFHFYIIPILQLAEKTRLITSVNPDYRVEPKGAKELIYLAEVINESAEAYQQLQTEVDEKITSAQAQLAEERTRLAALMSELPNGVVVCNTDGQILLYNLQAQQLLQSSEQEQYDQGQPGGLIGLGRSVFGVLDRDPIVHALDLLHQAVEKGQATPISSFMMTLSGGRCHRVNMAPVFSDLHGERRISGFVLTLEDMTLQIEADTRRDMLIQSLTDDLQTALEEIRGSISSILAQPELKPEQLGRYRKTIDSASRTLQDQIEQARGNYARHLQALSKVENVLGENLLEVLEKNIRERFEVEVSRDVEEGLWLEVDSYSIVQGISHLTGLLKVREGASAIAISLKGVDDDRAALSIDWPGCSVPPGFVEDWERSPLVTGAQGQILSFSDVVANHGGAVAGQPQGDSEHSGVRIDFPVTRSEEHRVVDNMPEHRPVYYEFDLFHRPGWKELGQQPLSKLTYVVFDTETTGLNPSHGDEIIQLGAIRIVNGRMLSDETIDQLVDPRRRVPPESVAIHGIEPHLLRGQPTIDRVLPLFHHFAEGSVLVAHNAAFDMKFLQLKERKTGLRFDHPVLDTLLLSSIVHPHQKSHNLDEIAQRLNVTVVGRHTALGDAIVTAQVLLKLLPLLEAQGIHTLEEALLASAESPFAKLKF